ncbi:hypothetical protein [Streptomyces sp. NBC_01198]|uniref:hypothetical protein n=1 Tax=Streptomyces sp. NBC_01198 TaxID=2903769 RepID=UPI002E0E147B|nr:hypothetical protein OG702_15540 [Streptomyces sp. NBC_01198]
MAEITATKVVDMSPAAISIVSAADQFARQTNSISEINRTVLPELEEKAKDRSQRIITEALKSVPESDVPEVIKGMRDLAGGILSVTNHQTEGVEPFTLKLEGSPGAALSHVVMTGFDQIQSAPHHELLRKSLLVSAVSGFEVLFGKIARSVFEVNSTALNDSDYSFTLHQLSDFSTIADAREFLIERQVNKLLFDSLDGWEKWIKRAAGGVSMVALPVDWDKVRETFARRNLIVHADGVVNHIYLDIIGKTQDQALKVHVGDRLEVNGEYLDTSIQEILALGRLLSIDVGMKLYKNEKGAYVNVLLSEINRLSHRKMWRANIALSTYALGCELTRSQELQARTQGWVARKEEFGLDAIKGEVEAWDVSGLAPIYSLRKDAILGKDSTRDKLRKLLQDGTLNVFEVATDPIYANFREQMKAEIASRSSFAEEDDSSTGIESEDSSTE